MKTDKSTQGFNFSGLIICPIIIEATVAVILDSFLFASVCRLVSKRRSERERAGYLVSLLHRGSKLLSAGSLEGVVGQVDRAPQCQTMQAPVRGQHLKHKVTGVNMQAKKGQITNKQYTHSHLLTVQYKPRQTDHLTNQSHIDKKQQWNSGSSFSLSATCSTHFTCKSITSSPLPPFFYKLFMARKICPLIFRLAFLNTSFEACYEYASVRYFKKNGCLN